MKKTVPLPAASTIVSVTASRTESIIPSSTLISTTTPFFYFFLLHVLLLVFLFFYFFSAVVATLSANSSRYVHQAWKHIRGLPFE